MTTSSWSERLSGGRAARIALYAGAVALALFEATTLWLALHPTAGATYRAYYIDQTTTCAVRPASGQYKWATLQSFRIEAKAEIAPIRVCGWDGPAGDGLHSIGHSSQLRFALPPNAGPLRLVLELVAVDASPDKRQVVQVVANGKQLPELQVATGEPQRFSIDLGVVGTEALDLELRYPNAVSMGRLESNTRDRAVKLTAAGVFPDIEATTVPPSR